MAATSPVVDTGDRTPAGLVYVPDVLTLDEETTLVARIGELDLGEVRMHGVAAKRTVKHFGWKYAYDSTRLDPGDPIPEWLAPLQARCARIAGVREDELAQVLVSKYPPGAGIGWHRDAPQFGRVVGVSLGAACTLKLRRALPADARAASTIRRAFAYHSVLLEPRSAYLLRGQARWTWQHHIPPCRALRWSITFRTFRTTPT